MESRAARLIRDDANQSLERSHADPPSGSAGLRVDAASLSSHVVVRKAKEDTMTEQDVKTQQAKFFSRLAEEVESGAPLLRSLRKLEDELGEPLRAAVVALGGAIEAGDTFSQALAKSPAVFEPGVLALVEGGEKAGWLQKVLPVVAQYVVR